MLVQNQKGNHPTKWDRTGEIMECRPHNQYTVKIDASGRITLRNRQYLRKYTPSPRNVLRGVLLPTINSDHHTEEPTSQPETAIQNNNNETAHCDPPIADSVDPSSEPNLTATDEPPQLTEPIVPQLRRSERVRQPTRVYDPSSGKYTLRTTSL